MLDQKIRSLWDHTMRPVGAALGRVGLTPNQITIIGVILQGVVAAFILQGRLFVAAVIAVAAALADGLDGAVAKARGTVNAFGALLDSTTDRLADALFFLPVAWLYTEGTAGAHRHEPWVAILALAGLVLSFLVSYVKARAEGLGYDCKVGIAERAERTIIMILGLAFDVLPAALILLTFLATVTLGQRLYHVWAQVVGRR